MRESARCIESTGRVLSTPLSRVTFHFSPETNPSDKIFFCRVFDLFWQTGRYTGTLYLLVNCTSVTAVTQATRQWYSADITTSSISQLAASGRQRNPLPTNLRS